MTGFTGKRLLIILCVFTWHTGSVRADDNTSIIVVQGAAGTDEYGEQFSKWTQHWQDVAKISGTSINVIGATSATAATADRDLLKSMIANSSAQSRSPLWLILIGHGTYARQTAKFNLRGPDISALELSQWLAGAKRPLVVVNCASSSGPFINRLSGSGRVIVSATKSGTEQNYARFGKYFAEAILSPESDLDHDDAVSVHEAFLRASANVQKFYDNEARISTEHALIDDNGDKRGTPAKMFRGIRPIAKAKDGTDLDGKFAKRITLAPIEKQLVLSTRQVQRRDEIEQALEQLRGQKGQLEEKAYQDKIEPLMIELATIYQAAETAAKK